jgi:hypothetical protein
MEQTILVCDVCGVPASTTVTIKADGKSLQKDLCSDHVGELVKGARAARPGRRRSPGPAPAKRRSAPAARKRRTSKKATATATAKPRRGRRPRAVAPPPEGPAEPGPE